MGTGKKPKMHLFHHRGSEHGMSEKAIWVIGGAPRRTKVKASTSSTRVTVHRGVGEGHMTDETG